MGGFTPLASVKEGGAVTIDGGACLGLTVVSNVLRLGGADIDAGAIAAGVSRGVGRGLVEKP